MTSLLSKLMISVLVFSSTNVLASNFKIGEKVLAPCPGTFPGEVVWKKNRILGQLNEDTFVIKRTGIIGLFSSAVTEHSCNLGKMSQSEDADKAAKKIEVATLDKKAHGESITVTSKTGSTKISARGTN